MQGPVKLHVVRIHVERNQVQNMQNIFYLIHLTSSLLRTEVKALHGVANSRFCEVFCNFLAHGSAEIAEMLLN